MKKPLIIFTILSLLLSVNLFAQNYNMGSSSIVTTCSGIFYDSGGPSGNYSKNENITMTFYPATAGNVLKFNFTLFNVETHPQCKKDYLRIYDGINTSSTLIGEYCGSSSPGEVIASNPDGAITFLFVSNNKDNFPGWVASIDCVSSGQGASGNWTGQTSTDWSTASNWDDGIIPGISTNVTIPSSPAGGNFPETNSGSEAVCNDLTIESGAHLYIPGNNSLSVEGLLNNLAGESGLIIKSDASGTGSLIHSTANVDATVERYLSKLEWHYIGSPVTNETAAIFDLPPGQSDIFLKTHIEATNTWEENIVDPSTPLLLGRGYAVYVGDPAGIQQDETVEFTGQLNVGDYTTGNSGFYNLQFTSGHGLNLICNPYPSALVGNIGSWTKKFVSNAIYVWDPDLGNYRYWNGTDGSNSFGYGTLTNGIIPAMQGFFVLANKSNPNTALTIPQSSRIHSSQPFYKSENEIENLVKVEVIGNSSSDAIFVHLNENATGDFDHLFDVHKLFGKEDAPQIYTVSDENLYSVNAIPPTEDATAIDVGFECGEDGLFTLSANLNLNFNQGRGVYLEDTKLKLLQDLRENNEYSFSYQASDNPQRFILHFGTTSDINSNNIVNSDINVYSNKNSIYVNNPGTSAADITIYNILGQKVKTFNIAGKTIESIPIQDNSGYYIVKVQSDKGSHVHKVFIQ